jgi:hypothetical protein
MSESEYITLHFHRRLETGGQKNKKSKCTFVLCIFLIIRVQQQQSNPSQNREPSQNSIHFHPIHCQFRLCSLIHVLSSLSLPSLAHFYYGVHKKIKCHQNLRTVLNLNNLRNLVAVAAALLLVDADFKTCFISRQ